MVQTLEDQLMLLCREVRNKGSGYWITPAEDDLFSARLVGDTPDLVLFSVTDSTKVDAFCVGIQGYIRNAPEPFMTAFIVNHDGSLRWAERGQDACPSNPTPVRAEDWSPFAAGDQEGIAQMQEILASCVEAALDRGRLISTQELERLASIPGAQAITNLRQ